jgi:hypothetical protein
MRGTHGLIITFLVLFSPIYSSHAQTIRAGGFAGRGISGGTRGARVGTIGSGTRRAVSNFRPGFSQVGPSSSFRGTSVRMGGGMANSSLRQRGFGQNISNSGPTFSSSSNLTNSTLGKNISSPQFQSISASRKNTMAPANRESMGFDTRRLNKAGSRFQKETVPSKTGRNYPSSNKIANTYRRLKKPLIIDNKESLISKRLNSNRNGDLKRTLTGKERGIKPFNEISISSAPNRDIVHWVDRNNGIRHYTNDINSIPQEAKTITLVDGKKPRLAPVSSEGTRNLRNYQSRFRDESFTSPYKTADLVMERAADFPGQRRGFAIGRDRERRNIHNGNHGKGFHHSKGFADTGPDHFRRHHFHHGHFFPVDPFFFGNSFFFFRPFFPLSSFFFVNNPFIFRPIFPSPLFGFRPFFVPAVPTVFFPVFPQFTAFTPFINPYFMNPFFNPFFFGTNFFSTSIAFNNLF